MGFNIIFKTGKRTNNPKHKEGRYKIPSASRFDYLDKDKYKIQQEVIEQKKLEKQLAADPDNQLLMKEIEKSKCRLAEIYKEYKSPEKQGHTFFVRGSLEESLQGKGFYELDNREDRLRALEAEWKEKLPEKIKGKQVGLRSFVYSVGEHLDGLSINAQEEVLKNSLENVMTDFKNQYVQRGDNMSYAYSIHKDTKHTHAHIYLLPYTDNGEYLSINSAYKGRKRKSKVEDKREFMLERAGVHIEKEVRKAKELSIESPFEKKLVNANELLNDRFKELGKLTNQGGRSIL
jgi:hypothetical protein